MTNIVFRDESYRIMGACIEVHKLMGSGFLEWVYQECLILEFKERNIPFHPQSELAISYKGHPLETKFFADFVCFDQILVEIKPYLNY